MGRIKGVWEDGEVEVQNSKKLEGKIKSFKAKAKSEGRRESQSANEVEAQSSSSEKISGEKATEVGGDQQGRGQIKIAERSEVSGCAEVALGVFGDEFRSA